MKREDKNATIEQLTERINSSKNFYITDIGGLDAEQTSTLRRECFKQDIALMVVKNTLLEKALEKADGEFGELVEALKGPTSLMFCEVANKPAKLIKDFNKKKFAKPELKAAFAEESCYVGIDQLDLLAALKSKEELLGDLIGLLQSPMRNLISSLESGKNNLTGVLKAMSEKEN